MKVLLEGFRQELRSLGQNNIRIGSISPGLVKTEAFERMLQNPAIAEMIQSQIPHIQSSDVADAVLQIIASKPHVQIHDVILRHVEENTNGSSDKENMNTDDDDCQSTKL